MEYSIRIPICRGVYPRFALIPAMTGVMGWRASQSITPQNDDLNKQGLFSQDVDVGDVDVRDVGDVRDMGT